MRVPDPKANNTTEAYLAYKAGFLEEGELKPSLYEPTLHFDAWLAYWAGLVGDYPTDKNGDPEMLTDEEALVAFLSEVTDTYPEEIKDPYDVRIVGYLKYLVSARFGRPEYPVNNEEFYLSTMLPPVVPSGDPSSSIDLEGTVEAPFISMEMYGDTYQKSYTGKNLFSTEFARSGASFVPYGDNGFILTKGATPDTRTINFDFPTALPEGTYAISGLLVSNDTGYGVSFRFYDSSNNRVADDVSRTSTGDFSFTITTTGVLDHIYAFISNSSGNGTSAILDEMQIELGSSATSFEPYVGGVPSPNPDCPQAVQTVTGSQVVAVTGGDGESAEYEIDLGDIELCKIGDYQDYIYQDAGGDWYVHKATGEVDLNTLTWTGVGSYQFIRKTTDITDVKYVAVNTEVGAGLAEKYIMRQASGMSSDSALNHIAIDVSAVAVNTGSQSINPTGLFYYALATATDTLITDNNLIAQLNALKEGGSYEGETHIRVSATGSNLPALLKVEAGDYR